MAFHVAITFPSEVEQLRKHAQAEQQWSATQRLFAVADTLATAETLSQAGAVRPAQLQYQERLEGDWRRRMKEFIQEHVVS